MGPAEGAAIPAPRPAHRGPSSQRAALAWVTEVHPHARHLARTLDWLLVLDPQAGEALRIAAVTHDAERAFPASGRTAGGVRRPAVGRLRALAPGPQRRVRRRLAARAAAADPQLVEQVCALVRVHEEGGSPEADLLQAADSLSFLEVQVELFAGMVGEGTLGAWAAEREARPDARPHRTATGARDRGADVRGRARADRQGGGVAAGEAAGGS